jgi:hypothetical protein
LTTHRENTIDCASQVFFVRQPPAQRLVVLVVVKVPKPLESAQAPSRPKLLTKDEARRVATSIAKLPDLLHR